MIINSILDNDQYKFSMQMCIAHTYDRVPVTYEFINRGKTEFPPGFDKALRAEVEAMATLRLTATERNYLQDVCYYLSPSYIDILRSYEYDPNEVNIRQQGGNLHVTVSGLWYRVVPWEVPLLAIISELYYRMKGLILEGLEWQALAQKKVERMTEAGVMVSDFGTRRRYAFMVQDFFVSLLAKAKCGIGTSNVHLAMKHGMLPIGTMAHEWGMAHAAMFGYRMATRQMLDAWVKVYKGDLGIALPDTFTSEVFFRDFDTQSAKLFDGIRWDSGDWKEFTEKVIAHYRKLRIDPTTKSIVYSDALDVDRAIEIHKYCNGRIRDRYGIGTNFTNDVGYAPLNIVIKLSSCDGIPVVKLSDSPGKATGLPEAISHCKYTLGLQ